MSAVAFIGLGANLGTPWQTLQASLVALEALPLSQLKACSSVYRSAPIDALGPDFLNAVVQLHTELDPAALLRALLDIEKRLGRTRSTPANGPSPARVIDLDLLLYDDMRLTQRDLELPHPRLHRRAFVLMPLLEIAPNLVLPDLGLASAFLADCADQRIEKLVNPLKVFTNPAK